MGHVPRWAGQASEGSRTDRAARPAIDSSDPLTSLRFGDRSQRRKRQKLLIRLDHSIAFTLAGGSRLPKWTLVQWVVVTISASAAAAIGSWASDACGCRHPPPS